jgi:hypothetical protein
VRREQLDGVAAARRDRVQPALVLLGGAQEGEEGRQAALAVEVGEAGDDVEEGRQRLAPRA